VDDASKHCDAYEACQIIRDGPMLMTEDRRLRLRGDVTKLLGMDGSQTEARVVFLFNDILIHGRPSKDGTVSFRGRIDLSTSVAKASETESNKRSHCFQVIATEHQIVSTMSMAGGPNMLFTSGNGSSTIHTRHLFQAKSREEQTAWVTELQRLIRAAKDKKAKASSAVRQSSDVPPSLSRSTTSSSSSTAASGGDNFDLRGKPLFKKMNSKTPRGINSHEFMP
jgi:hypothetical protein